MGQTSEMGTDHGVGTDQPWLNLIPSGSPAGDRDPGSVQAPLAATPTPARPPALPCPTSEQSCSWNETTGLEHEQLRGSWAQLEGPPESTGVPGSGEAQQVGVRAGQREDTALVCLETEAQLVVLGFLVFFSAEEQVWSACWSDSPCPGTAEASGLRKFDSAQEQTGPREDRSMCELPWEVGWGRSLPRSAYAAVVSGSVCKAWECAE